MSIRNFISTKPRVPSDLAQSLGSKGVTTILDLIRDAYFDLLLKDNVTRTMSENEITEEWFVCLNKRWKSADLSLVPIHEKADSTKKRSTKGKPPTVDCCFRHEWHHQSYFGIECKLIEANDKQLCDEYVVSGIQRFVSCQYGAKCSESAMLGYIRQTHCDDVATQLRMRVGMMCEKSEFVKADGMLPFDTYYNSQHQRTDCLSPFTIHHFLMFFQCQ